ncbi:MAG: hypothetical protein AAGI89_13830 [Pseudomonadota bacterium]
MVLLGLTLAIAAMAATDLREDDCVVGTHRAFAGDWSVGMIERVTPEGAAFESTRWIETNRWIDPYTLVIEQRDAFDQLPRLVITETITAMGFDLIVERNGDRNAFPLPLETSCTFDEETGLYRFNMGFAQVVGGVPYDYLIQIEIDDDHYALVRLRRPQGSSGERRMTSTQFAHRP